MSRTCAECEKRGKCIAICEEVEGLLPKLKPLDREVPYDPHIMDEMYSSDASSFWNFGVEEKDIDLDRLTERQRQCFVMRYTDGMTQKEIGKKLGITQQVVGQHIEYAKKKLKN